MAGMRHRPKEERDYGDGALASLWIRVAVGARRASGGDSGRGEPPLRLVLRAPEERVEEAVHLGLNLPQMPDGLPPQRGSKGTPALHRHSLSPPWAGASCRPYLSLLALYRMSDHMSSTCGQRAIVGSGVSLSAEF